MVFPVSVWAADSSVCRPPAAIGECPTGQDFFYSATYAEKVCQARVTCGAGQSMNCDSGCTTPAAGPVCSNHTVDIGTTAACCANGEVAKYQSSTQQWVCASQSSSLWSLVGSAINYSPVAPNAVSIRSTTAAANTLLDVNGPIRGKQDTDTTSYFGRAAIGYAGHSDYASFAHIDSNTTGGYALLQSWDGNTYLNAASGKSIFFRENNADKMVLKRGKVGIGNTNPPSTLTVSGDMQASSTITTSGNAVISGNMTLGGRLQGNLDLYEVANTVTISTGSGVYCGGVGSGSATCNAGDMLTGGGCDTAGGWVVKDDVSSYPNLNGWKCNVDLDPLCPRSESLDTHIIVYAYCIHHQ